LESDDGKGKAEKPSLGEKNDADSDEEDDSSSSY
jgi:hypothetical protein